MKAGFTLAEFDRMVLRCLRQLSYDRGTRRWWEVNYHAVARYLWMQPSVRTFENVGKACDRLRKRGLLRDLGAGYLKPTAAGKRVR